MFYASLLLSLEGTTSMGRHLETCPCRPKSLERGQQLLQFAQTKLPAASKTRLHNLLKRWLVRDQQSLSVLDHPDFRAFLDALPGDYMCPSRKTMTRSILTDFSSSKVAIKTYLATLPGRIALTTDGWTAGNGDQFQSLTGHFIDSNWTLHAILLDFAPFPVPHTAANAAALIWRTLQELDIDEKVVACVTDNTASAYNISVDLRNRVAPEHFFGGRCAAHLVNLVVKHSLDDADRTLIFAKCRAFVSLVHRSKPTEQALIKACETAGIKYKMPKTVMDVRWNSTLGQLLSLLHLEPALRLLFGERAYRDHAWGEPVWVAIRDITRILAIFKDVSEHLQGRKFPTMSVAAEGFVLMTYELNDLAASAVLSPWGSEVLKLFQTRLEEYRPHLIDSDVTLWATVLDPTMKKDVIEADGIHNVRDV
ncbi:hypothetical protein A4X03_0g9329, partial [Tilletia caries]